MKFLNYIIEMKIYKQSWPEFKTLIHVARSLEDKKSIMKKGFEIGRNTFILKGIYTRPYHWLDKTDFSDGSLKNGIRIYTRPDAKVFDNGCDRPMDALFGNGTPQYRKVYKEILNKLGYKVKIKPSDNQGRGDPERERFLDDKESRPKFMSMYYDWLKDNNYSLVVNGGEIIIIDPEKAIYKMEEM
jgi:hypothetical protein